MDDMSTQVPEMEMITRREASVRSFVWIVWAACLATAFCFVAYHRRDVPVQHDLDMIPALTGHEPVDASYLWKQAAEHRLFLQKLLILGLSKVTDCDFRSEGFANVCLLGTVALAMILAVRRVRGRTSFVDAFFPILLLSPGNCLNCLFTWSHTVAGVAATAPLLVVMLCGRNFDWRAIVAFGFFLLALPLCPAEAVAFVPSYVVLLLLAAVMRWRQDGRGSARDVTLMAVFAMAATALVIFYFHGFHWRELPRGHLISNFIAFFAISVGPGAGKYAGAVSVFVLFSIAVTSGLLMWTALADPRDRLASLALLGFFASTAIVAAAIAWSRGGIFGPQAAMGNRFSVLATPALCAVFLAWQLSCKGRFAFGGQLALLILLLFLLPGNIEQGLGEGRMTLRLTENITTFVSQGIPPEELAKRRFCWLPRKPEEKLERIQMLLESKVSSFGKNYQTQLDKRRVTRTATAETNKRR